MKMHQALSLLACTLLTGQAFATNKSRDVIYGEDNRKDVYATEDSVFVELSRSTAGMINEKNLSSSGGVVTVSGRTLQERGICASERFSQQISGANCSGFLVAPDLLVTAGHCVRSEADCQTYKWVFDYKVEHEDQREVEVPESSVYACKRIVSRSLDSSTKDDYALIQLARRVEDRSPLKFRSTGKVYRGAPLVVIGHPTGLPTKIADGANVRSLSGKFFVANLDTYGGNSGSAVINVKTSEVEGILVRGETDYVYDYDKGCQVSNKCSDSGCRGEDVTYITNVPGLKNL